MSLRIIEPRLPTQRAGNANKTTNFSSRINHELKRPTVYHQNMTPITILAPTETTKIESDQWQPGHGTLLSHKFLGKIQTIAIHKELLETLRPLIPRSAITSGTMYRFSNGADIIRIEINSEEPDVLLRRSADYNEENLEVALFQVASATISGIKHLDNSSTTATGVDWLFPIIETEAHLDEREIAPSTHKYKSPSLCVADEERGSTETAMWISWTSAQVRSFASIQEACEITKEDVIETFLICCAGWKLLSIGGSDAAKTINESDNNDDLIRLQRTNAAVLVAHHRTLWTTNRYLKRIFDGIDAEWDIPRELSTVTGIMSATSELLAADQESRSKRQERNLALFGAGLGALAFVSAAVDVFNVLPHEQSSWARVLCAIAIPATTVILLLGVLRKSHSSPLSE